MDLPIHSARVRRRRLAGAALLSAALACGPVIAAGAQIAAPWTQALGGPTHSGYAADAPAPPYREVWRLDAPTAVPSAFGASAPVVDGSTVLTVTPKAVVAGDVASGHQLWTAERDYGPPVSPAVAYAGKARLLLFTEGFGDSPPTPSPTPSAGADGSPTPAPSSTGPFDSHLMAIDLATHEPAWKAPLPLKEVSRTGVTVSGDTAYVGDNRGNVYSVDVTTGELRWTVSVEGFLGVPLAATDDLVIATVQASRTVPPRVIALKASDGSQDWSSDASASAAFATAPAIDGDHVIVGFSDGTIRAFSSSDGSEVWSARMNAPIFFTGAPAVAPDAVVAVDSLGQVYRLDPDTGERAWDFALNRSVVRGAPVVAGGTVLVASGDGRLAAIDLSSGKLVWESQATDVILRSLTLTPDVVIAVRGGTEGGLVGYGVDPAGSTTSIVSPTVLNLPLLLGAFFAAALPLGAALILAGRALRARMGPAFLEDDAEIVDPWEPDEPDEVDR